MSENSSTFSFLGKNWSRSEREGTRPNLYNLSAQKMTLWPDSFPQICPLKYSFPIFYWVERKSEKVGRISMSRRNYCKEFSYLWKRGAFLWQSSMMNFYPKFLRSAKWPKSPRIDLADISSNWFDWNMKVCQSLSELSYKKLVHKIDSVILVQVRRSRAINSREKLNHNNIKGHFNKKSVEIGRLSRVSKS